MNERSIAKMEAPISGLAGSIVMRQAVDCIFTLWQQCVISTSTRRATVRISKRWSRSAVPVYTCLGHRTAVLAGGVERTDPQSGRSPQQDCVSDETSWVVATLACIRCGYAYNLKGNCAHQHQMSFNGIRDHFEMDDLVVFGAFRGMKPKNARDIVAGIHPRVKDGMHYADQAGVPASMAVFSVIIWMLGHWGTILISMRLCELFIQASPRDAPTQPTPGKPEIAHQQPPHPDAAQGPLPPSSGLPNEAPAEPSSVTSRRARSSPGSRGGRVTPRSPARAGHPPPRSRACA